MKFSVIIIVLLGFMNNCHSQSIIEMQNINGIFHIPCKVNNVPMMFVFDTGASNVSISLTEAKFLIKQGLITERDFIATNTYRIANGDLIEGTEILLRKIEIGEATLQDVKATIVHEQNAPLLLGQSAISKLGTYTVADNKLMFNSSTTEIYMGNIDTIFGGRKNYVPKLSSVNHKVKEDYGFTTYVLKEKGVDEAWIKMVNPKERKIDKNGKVYFKNGRCRLQYFEFDCKSLKFRCTTILYFDNNDLLTAASTEVLTEYFNLSDPHIYEEYIEIFNFVCDR